MNFTAAGVAAAALIASPLLLSVTMAFQSPVSHRTRHSHASPSLFATIESQQEQQAIQFDDQDDDISEDKQEQEALKPAWKHLGAWKD